MSKTQECIEAKLQTTRWQVAGKIILALIGVWIASMATHTATTSASKDTVDNDARQMDTVVLPAIQKLLEELKVEVMKNTELRERVAWLEGIVESIPGRRGTPRRKLKPWGLDKMLDSARKRVTAKKQTRLPTLRYQHQQMGPNLETPISNEETP